MKIARLIIMLFILLNISCTGMRENKTHEKANSKTYKRAKLQLRDGTKIYGKNPMFHGDSLISVNVGEIDDRIHSQNEIDSKKQILKLKDLHSLKLGTPRSYEGVNIGGIIGFISAAIYISDDKKNVKFMDFSSITNVPIFIGICFGGAYIGYQIGSKIFRWENYDLTGYYIGSQFYSWQSYYLSMYQTNSSTYTNNWQVSIKIPIFKTVKLLF